MTRTPPMPHAVWITNPGVPVVDPVTRNEIPGDDVTAGSRGYLSQRPVSDSSLAAEISGSQDTVVSLFTLIVPKGTVISSKSVVTDAEGAKYQVIADPAKRPRFIAVALKRVSDLQK